MEQLNDEFYMRQALQLAQSTKGQTEINPAVGCVVVKNGSIVGIGAHLKRGTAHAEVHALDMAKENAEGSTVYVTLEPCSHYGKTPPCSDRLITEKVKKVVIACEDPNPQVAGSGIQRLKDHGVEVEVGILQEEALHVNEMFNKFIVRKIPFVTSKTASTLDGKIASKSGDSRWISNAASREFVHTLRHQHQAIMVGIETVLTDNPQLSTRLSVPAHQPIRIIVDSKLRIPRDAAVIQADGSKTIVLTAESASNERKNALISAGVEIIVCGAGPQVDLQQAMKRLGEREIGSILLEGGSRLHGAMLEQQLIDKMIFFIAPKIIGGERSPSNITFSGFEKMQDAIQLTSTTTQLFGSDICITGYPQYS